MNDRQATDRQATDRQATDRQATDRQAKGRQAKGRQAKGRQAGRQAKGRFVLSAETPQETLDWGQLRWMSHPPTTGSTQLTVIEVSIMPGQGHDFHKHPDQEEVIYVMSGQVEQWLEQDSSILSTGDSLFIAADTVHASFNCGDEPARLLAILGPCVGDMGYELVDVAAQEPWASLRSDSSS